jgi:transcriptional regulator with XRE-family HTH domain
MIVQRDAPPKYPKLARRIQQRREKAGYTTQLDLAYEMRIAQSTISMWERGLSEPRPRFRKMLAELIGGEPADYMAK